MGTFLQQQVLGTKNVTGIYALEPMSHLQTANKYPDMAGLVAIQQFALLNQISLVSTSPGQSPYTGNSYPINTSYTAGSLPNGVAEPLVPCPACQGLEFSDDKGNNIALATRIVKANVPGFHVFSAPWETTSALLANINKANGYNLNLPTTYMGPNYVYAISISPFGLANLVTYNSNLNPPSTYPVLSSPPLAGTPCTAQTSFSITATGGVNGVVIPSGSNTNQTLYMIRHAEAHPVSSWDDGNFVGAGQWRALGLPNALRGKISPNQVYSIDPAQVYPGAIATPGNSNWSYIRPSLTVAPYVIANNLPYYLVADFELFASNSPQLTSDFFFKGGKFSNQTVLLAWEHAHFPPIVTALLASYKYSGPAVPQWPSADYDTIWTVRLDATGNLTVNNALCEGIDSASLPATPPPF
ncbi:MAG: hypothetical protein HQK55_16370 [Deltaproteobacteria bacterium]|nr:hypothetical protein [Deltaproteobacteria bacterium]